MKAPQVNFAASPRYKSIEQQVKYRRGVYTVHCTHIHPSMGSKCVCVIRPGIRGSAQMLKGRLTQQAALNEAGQAAKAIMALPEKTHDC